MGAADLVRRSDCRICGHTALEEILHLGQSPLANAFLASPAEFAAERRFPLDLYFCDRCGLLQLLDVVNPELLFRHYVYMTGISTTIAHHNREYASTLVEMLGLTPNDLVVEIASNDGSLLKCFQALGVRILGVEPATNIAARATADGVETVNEFFSNALAESLAASRQPARVIAANNVLAHVDDPADFLRGCRRLLADDGLITIEVPYVRALLERIEYDTVYHEHLSYFSVTSMLRLAERANLRAARIDRLPVHGGSLRVYLSRTPGPHDAGALEIEREERAAGGAANLERHRQLARDTERHRRELRGLLEDLRAQGKKVAGYGAPAKGNTLLNYCDIDTSLMRYTADKNPLKVGLFTPGMHIPVREVSVIEQDRPDYLLVLAWNFADEVMEQQAAHRARGGRFIIPIPGPKIA